MKILLTGANGYVGKRLLPVLLEQGHEVICLVRDERRFMHDEVEKMPHSFSGKVSIIQANLLEPETLNAIPQDIDAAYYLVHSMSSSLKKFEEMEETCAGNFVTAIDKTDAKQVIYLSGIVNDERLSKHLRSRLNVERILQSSKIPVTVLRAAIIIGSGSASFEMIRDLVEQLPIMITPHWLNVKCQPIAIRDVLSYLAGVLLKEQSYAKVFDIGGPDILSYKEMLEIFADHRHLKRWIFTMPIMSVKLSSYWLYYMTSTTYSLARSLVESLRNEVVCEHHGIKDIVPIKCISYEKSVMLAFTKIAQNEVVSCWTDALVRGRVDHDFLDNIEVPHRACFIDKRHFDFQRDSEQVRENIWSIGGDRGWYSMNWAWKVRGMIDKLFGGVGLKRRRRHPHDLREGDALDFWRVLLADKEAKRLILFAEMKVPGEAWLEFKISQNGKGSTLEQTATFRPHGLMGRLYWYLVAPFHNAIFDGMAKGIIAAKA